jgi:hypothetical protein
MTTSGVSGAVSPSKWMSVPSAEERTAAVLNKLKDAETAQAEGLINLIKVAGEVGRNLDVFA